MSRPMAHVRFVTDAQVPEPFRSPSDISSGSPVGGFGRLMAVQAMPKFQAQPRASGQGYAVFMGSQRPTQKEQTTPEIRFRADAKARELAATGEQEFRTGNAQRGLDAFENALALTRNAVVFSAAIRTAVEFDRVDLARKWAVLGHQRDPSDPSLARWHKLLSPPTIRSVDTALTRRTDEVAWLEANANQYRGKWVVVAGSQLLGFGNTLTEALSAARSRGPITGALTHHISE